MSCQGVSVHGSDVQEYPICQQMQQSDPGIDIDFALFGFKLYGTRNVEWPEWTLPNVGYIVSLGSY